MTATDAAATDAAATDAADYAGAGFTGALQPGARTALVIVDPVQAYVDPTCGLYAGVEEPVERMRELLAAARASGVHVAITTMALSADGSNAGVFFRKVPALAAYLPGSSYGDFIDGLEPLADDTLVPKQYPSAFFGTSLAAGLHARGVDTVILAGLSTSGCIRATATDAMQNGFIPIVAREAVGDRLPSVHEANLFDIAAKIGEVWPLAKVIEHWEGV